MSFHTIKPLLSLAGSSFAVPSFHISGVGHFLAHGLQFRRSYPFLFILISIFVIVVVGYIITATALMERDYAIKDLHNQITAAQTESRNLQITMSQESSLEHLLEASLSSSYAAISSVHYVERSVQSPFTFVENN